MTKRALDKLPLNEAALEVLSWSTTTLDWLRGLPDAQLKATGESLLEIWGEVTFDRTALGDLQAEIVEEAGKRMVAGDELALAVVLHCTIFFDYIATELSRRGSEMTTSAFAWLTEPVSRMREPTKGVDWLEQFTAVYWAFLITALGLPVMRALSAFEPFADAWFEAECHHALGALNGLRSRVAKDGSEYEKLLADFAVDSALRIVWRSYREQESDVRGVRRSGDRLHPGPFSMMRPRELPALAIRSAAMSRRYGEKSVEKVFETQLSLIIQSLGFVVVQTRSGERRVDLLCIGGGLGDGFTFLLEAKTSARPYGFSTADERALREYVRDVRRSLDTLPPLRLVLVVGARPAKTLAAKLKKFQAENSIPTRFMSATELANLREALAGPVRRQTFLTGLLASPVVVKDENVRRLIADHRDVEEAHATLVRSLLASSDWPKGNEPRKRLNKDVPRLRRGRT